MERKHTKKFLCSQLKQINVLLKEYKSQSHWIQSKIKEIKEIISKNTTDDSFVNPNIIKYANKNITGLRYTLHICNERIINLKNLSRIYNKELNEYYNFWNTVPNFHIHKEIEKYGKRINKH